MARTSLLFTCLTFFAYFDSIVSTINGSMTEKPAESTMLSTFLVSTTASGPNCGQGQSQCDDRTTNPCSNGICCYLDNKDPDKGIRCVCNKGFKGKFCQGKVPDSARSTGYEGAQAVAVISALIGVLAISFFAAVVVLQIKYYKQRKKRLEKDEEIRKSMRVKPEIRRRDDASTRLLRTQPGYSWRQSVKRTNSASQKSKGLSMSISVPEKLYEIGLMREREKETNQTKSSHGGGGEAEGSERLCIDPTIDESEVNSSSTIQLFQDKDPPKKAAQFQNNSDLVQL